jgi:hypothetical protein
MDQTAKDEFMSKVDRVCEDGKLENIVKNIFGEQSSGGFVIVQNFVNDAVISALPPTVRETMQPMIEDQVRKVLNNFAVGLWASLVNDGWSPPGISPNEYDVIEHVRLNDNQVPEDQGSQGVA